MTWQVRIVRNRYADSVRLMAIAKELRARPHVTACEVAMGTGANLEALRALGAQAEGSPADVVIAVDTEAAAAAAVLDEAEAALAAVVAALAAALAATAAALASDAATFAAVLFADG